MAKVYEQDYSPEGSSFYAKMSLQKDHLFIEHVMSTSAAYEDEEGKLIAQMEGTEIETDYTDERAILLLLEVLLPHSYRVVYSLRTKDMTLIDIADVLGIDYYLVIYRLKQATIVLEDYVSILSDYQKELLSMKVARFSYKYIGEWFGMPSRKCSKDYRQTLEMLEEYSKKYSRRK